MALLSGCEEAPKPTRPEAISSGQHGFIEMRLLIEPEIQEFLERSGPLPLFEKGWKLAPQVGSTD